MSNLEDVRELFRDLITPDLKALEAGFASMEQKIGLKSAASDQKAN